MTSRVYCLVPHCSHSRGRRPDEDVVLQCGLVVVADAWICSEHWRQVPRDVRAMHNEAKRRLRKERTLHSAALANRVWIRCTRAAIERSAGI